MKRQNRTNRRQLTTERLENRCLLAGDLFAGDANGDYFFDAADWILVMKAGKFNTAAHAVWEEGDFDANMRFDSQDIVEAFKTGNYNQGAYDEAAKSPINELASV